MPKHLALALLAVSAFASAQTISSKTTGMKHIEGYLPLDWDAKAGKLYLEIPHFDPAGNSPDILYTHSLPYGTGSNDLGLDRGQISRGQLIHFQRTGPKVLMIEPNERFRSTSTDPAEVLGARTLRGHQSWNFPYAAPMEERPMLARHETMLAYIVITGIAFSLLAVWAALVFGSQVALDRAISAITQFQRSACPSTALAVADGRCRLLWLRSTREPRGSPKLGRRGDLRCFRHSL